ncbi:hypothetical protein [Dyella sp. 2HG41-7]|uniref:hypothetical protein n=1 Tax=Dyella sp. 2HG41-7 TaxID=2883239 RepID=UPI001F318FD3|nr:hypothetical protein [Dyella sp. 2HG41-7]
MARSRPAVGLMLLCVTGVAFSASPQASAPSAQVKSSPPPTQSASVDGFGQAVSPGTLQHFSGGGLVQNIQSLTGTVTGNTATQVSTGTNSISSDAFSGSTGMPTVVQNTGNNVLIQTGVIVNVQMKP